MLDKIVYITGAGFSRPLGLPLMDDFYEKSKDLYIENKEDFNYFNEVFETIKKLHHIKSFYKSDLFNIEEILSILEMWQEVGGKREKESIKDYIKDVIKNYTPEDPKFPNGFPSNWYDTIAVNSKWKDYLYFSASIFMEELFFHKESLKFEISKTRKNLNCSLITLNYDLVIEKCLKYWKENTFIQTINGSYDKIEEIEYCKLHGSLSGEIVPPTWNKGLRDHIKNDWIKAHKILKNANYIVFIGYSLPKSDSYIRYLLKSSVINSINLKNISVINPGLDDGLKDDFNEFIEFKNVRYFNYKTEDYLQFFRENILKGIPRNTDYISLKDPVEIHKQWLKSDLYLNFV